MVKKLSQKAKNLRKLRKQYNSQLVPDCLMEIQMLEETLKQMIIEKYKFLEDVTAKTRCKVKAKPSKKIRKLPLGALIEEYEIFSDDPQLIKKLEGFCQKRNSVAHESYLITASPMHYGDDDILDIQTSRLNDKIREVVKITADALALCAQLQRDWVNTTTIPRQ